MFSMKGRIGRANYFFTAFGLSIVCYILAFAVGYAAAGSDPSESSITALGYLISIPFSVLIAFAAVRRLHDLGRPGTHYWLLLIPLYNIYLGLVLVFQGGNEGENEYGPKP